jgi:phage terminase large subunit-like protein
LKDEEKGSPSVVWLEDQTMTERMSVFAPGQAILRVIALFVEARRVGAKHHRACRRISMIETGMKT